MNKEDKKDIPVMDGENTDERLQNLWSWWMDNCKDGDALTLQEIGDAVGLTRERVRQIEAGALKKLRHPALISHLKD